MRFYKKCNSFIKSIILLILISLIGCKKEYNPQLFSDTQNQISKQIWDYIYSDFAKFNSRSPEVFTAEIDSLRSILTNHLSNNQGLISDSLYYQEKFAIKLAFDKFLLEYPQQHKNYTGENIKIPAEVLKKINANRQIISERRLFENKDVQAYVQAVINTQAHEFVQKGFYRGQDNQYLSARLSAIENTLSDSEQKNIWKFKILKAHIDNIGVRNLDKHLADFKNTVSDTSMVNQISDLANEHIKARKNHKIETYKSVDTYNLEAHIFLPERTSKPTPVILYFHGGSWSEGKPDWFFESGQSYAKNGWAAIAIEYRILGRHNTLPFEAVKDAKTSIRWIRENASRLNINPNQIVVTGNSAGGHLALATTLVSNWNEHSDNLDISAVPNVVMVNAAVYDLTVPNSKWIVRDFDDPNLVKQISPNDLIKRTDTKYLLIHGEADGNCSFESAQYFYDNMKAIGNDITLHSIPDAGHFIWFGKYAKDVYPTQSRFLQTLSFK